MFREEYCSYIGDICIADEFRHMLVRPGDYFSKCVTNKYYVHAFDDHLHCVHDCKEVTKCGEIVVPDEHLLVRLILCVVDTSSMQFIVR